MIILGIDTSSHLNSVGLVDDEQILADFTWEAMDNSLQRIVGVIDSVLVSQGLTLDRISGLGICTGPGSWTGVRVGVTVGKIFAYATGKSLCGISSLDTIAFQVKDSDLQISPLIDGGHETVYSAFYRPSKGTIARIGDYYSGDIKGLTGRIEVPTLFLGTATDKYRHILVENLGPLASFRDETEVIQKGATVALLALSRLKRGEANEALSLTPLYLRESAAQARLPGKATK